METVVIAAVVVLAWAVVIALVRAERGWVGLSDVDRARLRLKSGILELQIAFGEALAPTIRQATEAMRAFADAWERARE